MHSHSVTISFSALHPRGPPTRFSSTCRAPQPVGRAPPRLLNTEWAEWADLRKDLRRRPCRCRHHRPETPRLRSHSRAFTPDKIATARIRSTLLGRILTETKSTPASSARLRWRLRLPKRPTACTPGRSASSSNNSRWARIIEPAEWAQPDLFLIYFCPFLFYRLSSLGLQTLHWGPCLVTNTTVKKSKMFSVALSKNQILTWSLKPSLYFSAIPAAASNAAFPPKFSARPAFCRSRCSCWAVKADVARQHHRRCQRPEWHVQRTALGAEELHRASDRHLRLLGRQGRRADLLGGFDHLRLEEEWWRVVGGGHEWRDRPFPGQLRRSDLVNWRQNVLSYFLSITVTY